MNAICSRELLEEYRERCLLLDLNPEMSGFKYTIDKDNNYILQKYIGKDTEIYLGDMFDIIEMGAFENTNVTSIDFGIATYIGNRVCLNCQRLEFIKATECITVNRDSFRDCFSLKQALFEKVEVIGVSGFASCNNLISITGLEHLKFIGQHAFNLCTNLKEVYLGKGLNELPKNVFNNCYSLEKINTENVEVICKRALGCCQSLEHLDLSNLTRIESVGVYGDMNVETIVLGSSYYNKLMSYFKDFTSLKQIIFKGLDSELAILQENLINCGLSHVKIIKA